MAEAAQAKPIEDVRDISAITYGFMASKALFAALDFDLFTHIDRGAELSNRARKGDRRFRESVAHIAHRIEVLGSDRPA